MRNAPSKGAGETDGVWLGVIVELAVVDAVPDAVAVTVWLGVGVTLNVWERVVNWDAEPEGDGVVV